MNAELYVHERHEKVKGCKYVKMRFTFNQIKMTFNIKVIRSNENICYKMNYKIIIIRPMALNKVIYNGESGGIVQQN